MWIFLKYTEGQIPPWLPRIKKCLTEGWKLNLQSYAEYIIFASLVFCVAFHCAEYTKQKAVCALLCVGIAHTLQWNPPSEAVQWALAESCRSPQPTACYKEYCKVTQGAAFPFGTLVVIIHNLVILGMIWTKERRVSSILWEWQIIFNDLHNQTSVFHVVCLSVESAKGIC